jgi:hypothetical protein
MLPTEATIPGIDSYLSVDGVQFMVTDLSLERSYKYMGENVSPVLETDLLAVLSVDLLGPLETFQSWMTEDDYGLYVIDGSGRQEFWALYDITDGVGEIVFVVDAGVNSLTLVFPGGEEIDLTPFLIK